MIKSIFTNLDLLKILLITTTIILAVLIGISFLILPLPYAPLIVLLGLASIVSLFIWFGRPEWILYLAIFVVFLPTSLIPTQINSYVNRGTTILALLMWLFEVIRKKRQIILSPSTYFMFFFLIWAVITLSWADNFDDGLVSLQRYVLRLILFLLLIINIVNSKKTLDGLMKTIAASNILLLLVSLISVLQQGYSVGSRLQVLDVNENGLGISLIVTMPGVLYLSFNQYGLRKKLLRLVTGIFLFVVIGLIGLSGSRGGAISLGIILFSFLFWKSTRFWGILGITIIFLVIIFFPVLFSTTITRFLGSPGASILGGREMIWPAAWQLIKNNLITGIGIGNSRYQIIPYFANLGIFDLSLLSTSESALHNPILVVWAETGLPGLLLYLGILASAVYAFVKEYFQLKNSLGQKALSYFAVVASIFLGYMASWIKGGGLESSFSYFLVLALLILPRYLKFYNW